MEIVVSKCADYQEATQHLVSSQCGRHQRATVWKPKSRRMNRKDWSMGRIMGTATRKTPEHPELLPWDRKLEPCFTWQADGSDLSTDFYSTVRVLHHTTFLSFFERLQIHEVVMQTSQCSTRYAKQCICNNDFELWDHSTRVVKLDLLSYSMVESWKSINNRWSA